MSHIIDIKGLTMTYGEVTALDNIGLQVREGELFGVLGPDGAGKTSLFRLITTLLVPDSGSLRVCGLDPVADYKELRRKIGYMPGKFSLYQDLSVEENLRFFATVFGTTIEENYHLIRDIYKQIEPFKTRPAGKLSGGMKQKLALSCALIHKPELLVLDEPTTGVDAVSRKEFWEMLRTLRAHGISIIVATPYMDEASLCDRVALVQKGKIMQVASPQEIIDSYPLALLEVGAANKFTLIQDLRAYPGVFSAYAFGEYLHLASQNPLDTSELKAYLEQKNHTKLHIAPIGANIEDCFMYLMTIHHDQESN